MGGTGDREPASSSGGQDRLGVLSWSDASAVREAGGREILKRRK
jgi:hypothetical protein